MRRGRLDVGEVGTGRSAYPLAVGVRWSEIVDDGDGRLSRNGASVGGADRGSEKPRGGLWREPLLCGGIVCEMENKIECLELKFGRTLLYSWRGQQQLSRLQIRQLPTLI